MIKDVVVALHTALIIYQARSKSSRPLKIWSALTFIDCFLRHPLPRSVMIHHVSGLAVTGTILYRKIRHPFKNMFIFLELAFISSYMLNKSKFSRVFKAIHLFVHIFIRWPIIVKGIRVGEELGLWFIKPIGHGMICLDMYWLYHAMKHEQAAQVRRVDPTADDNDAIRSASSSDHAEVVQRPTA